MKKLFMTVCLLFVAFGHGSLHAAKPVLWWSFDQNTQPTVKDHVTGVDDAIEGNYRYLPGVLGSAIKPDGYTTCITRRTVDKTMLGDSALTVEAWIAQAAYPWNWCPVITQSKDQTEGFSFNVGPNGDFALAIAVEGKWYQCVSPRDVLPLRKWKHIAATFDSQKGVRLYVDGKLTGQWEVTGKLTPASQSPLRSLMNYEKVKPSNIHRQHGTLAGWFSIDGLVDEVKLYKTALSTQEIVASFHASAPKKDPPLERRVMPSGPKGPGRFGAYYCKLKYYKEWDNLWAVAADPDVLVRFDHSATRMVFWRGSRYSPAWVSENGLWMADQSVEAFYGRRALDKEGCFEHMQDPRCRYSHVRIIENSDARAVVHWRYAPVSSHNHLWRENPKTGRACWVDEYYYVYPDQMAIRNVSWKTGTLRGGGMQFQESLAFTQPGQLVSDVVHDDFAHVANLQGEIATLKYCQNPDKTKKYPDNLLVQQHNFKAVNKPSIIFEQGSRMRHVFDRRMGERGLNVPGACNHWPVGQPACDGRTAQEADRPTHCLGFPITSPTLHENNGRSWWNGLYGMTDLSMKELVFVANSWNHAPELKINSDGFESEGYDMGQRAYVIHRKDNASAETFSMQLAASRNSPVDNPAFVIKNWDKGPSTLILNGKRIKRGKEFRVGVHHTLDRCNVIVWIETKSIKPVSITLQ